jgi:hypothetical protein
LLAALVTGKNLGAEASARARDTHTGEPADLRGQIAEIEAFAVVQARERGVFVIAEFQTAVLLSDQNLLDQAFQLHTHRSASSCSKNPCTRQSPA